MSNQHYSGMVTFTLNEEEYEAQVSARATYSYRPGKRWLKNGDPGYPDESDFEIDDVEVEAVSKDDVEIPYDEDTMYDSIESALNDVDWEDDDPPEPDYDDYEEAAIAKYESDCIRMGY